MSLAIQKPIFESQVKQILYKGYYDAIKASVSIPVDTEEPMKTYLEVNMENIAQKQAVTFVNSCASDLCNAIDQYIKSMSISITGPIPGNATLSNTAGPVTGTINILPSFVQIS